MTLSSTLEGSTSFENSTCLANNDALLSALVMEQETHNTKTNKQKRLEIEDESANAPIGPLERSWG